jgi:hypothetical protein
VSAEPDAGPGDAARTGVERTVALLADAARYLSRVHVRRSIRDAIDIDGFVVATSPAWTLLARLIPDTMQLDGYVAIRTRDVSRVRVWVGEPETFAIRALQRAGEWPPAVPDPFPLDSTASVLAAAATMAPLVHLETEVADPDRAMIGRVLRIAGDEVLLREIDAEAEWDPEPTAYPLDDVTLVDVGGRYDAALYAVGGEPPPA